MKFRNDSFLLKCIVLMVLAIIALSMQGCAKFTEEYWQEEYANMTEEEKESASNLGPDLITAPTVSTNTVQHF